MIATQSKMSPPNHPPLIGLELEDDYIRELGDRIANLTLKEAEELSRYLKEVEVQFGDDEDENFITNCSKNYDE